MIWLLLIYGLVAVAYSVIIPFGEPPDEAAHYAYIWYLLAYRQLPVQSPDHTANLVDEGHHPPAYYATVAWLTGWAPYELYKSPDNPYVYDLEFAQRYLHPEEENFPWQGPLLAAHLARLVSIGMGIASIWVTYRIARHVAPEDSQLALFAAGIHAFNPMFVHINSAINNDNAAILMGSLMIWQMLRILRHPSFTRCALLGALTGLGLLSKINLIALLPAIAWTIWRAAGQHEQQYRTLMHRLQRATIYGALVLMPMLAVSGWWLWRNVQLYGDPLAWGIRMVTHYAQRRQTQMTIVYVAEFLWRQFRSFWGLFGWVRIDLAPWIYWLLLGFSIVGVAGIVQDAAKHRKALLLRNYDLYALIIGGTLLATWSQASNRDSMVAGQGRFLFPAISIIAFLLAKGCSVWLSGRHRRRMQRIGMSSLFTLTASVLLFLMIPTYIHPLREVLPRQAHAIQAAFDPWELVGWHNSDPVIGSEMSVTLYWRALRQLDTFEQRTPVFCFVHLVDSNGEPLAKWDGVPTQGRFPPQVWTPDAIVAHTINLQLPGDESFSVPRLAYLYVGFFYLEDEQIRRIPVNSTDTPTLEGTAILGPVILRSSQRRRATPESPLEITFGTLESGEIELLGYDLVPGNNEWQVILYWRARTELPKDYTIFVHLATDDILLSQGDGPPCNGQCPTSLWRAGDAWRDVHTIPLPTTATATTSPTLTIGWYDPQTGTRLPAFSEDGQRLNQDRLSLCTFSEGFTICR